MKQSQLLYALAAVAFSALPATAQLDLPDEGDKPRKVPAGPKQGRGDIAPHLVCTECESRNYTAMRNRPAAQSGFYFAVCAYCKEDRMHREGRRRGTGDLDLPDRARPVREPALTPKPRDPSAPDLPTFPGALSEQAQVILEEISKSPSSSMRAQALRNLKSMGEDGVLAGRVALRDERAELIEFGAQLLLESGRGAEVERVAQRLRDPLPGRIGPGILDRLVTLDPVHASPRLLCSLLDHPQGAMRQAAAKHLALHSSPELLVPLADALKSKRTSTRTAAVNLIAGIEDPSSLGLLLEHLADGSPTVCGRVLDHLARSEDERLDVELLRRAFSERWILRPSAYALLAVIDREDLESRAILDERHAPSLLSGLESSDPLVRGTCAAALAGIGFRSEDSAATSWVDDIVPLHLIASVSGSSFHTDYASLQPRAMRRIELITGERIGTDGGEWVDWWAAHRANFRALRASFAVELHEVSRLAIRYRDKGGAYSIAGFDAPAPRGPEERVVLSATQMANLVAALRSHGILSSERLPGVRGKRSEVERELTLRVLGREKRFLFGEGADEDWFTQVMVLLDAQRARQRWQLFAPTLEGERGPWEAEALWWDGDHDELARAERMKRLLLTHLQEAPPSQRQLGLEELERVFSVEGVSSLADLEALLTLISEESFYSDRCGRLVDLTRGILVGDSATVLRARERLISVLVERFGDRGAASVAAVISDCSSSQLLGMSSDGRPLVRALLALQLRGTELPEERAVLLALLDDEDSSVEAAAVSSLGHARLEGARTELLLRARFGEGAVRLAALEAIGRLGGEGVRQALVTGLAERDAEVQLSALKGLTHLSDPESISLFISYLQREEDSELHEVALGALKGFGEEAHDELLRIAESATHKGRRQAAMILSESCVGAVAEPLAILLAGGQDPAVARELAVLTCFDLRKAEQPAAEYLSWLRGQSDKDAWRWFVEATARRELFCPPPSAFAGEGSREGASFLLMVIERCEPFLAERASRELERMLGAGLVDLPADSAGRARWLESARELVDRVHAEAGGGG